MAAVSERDAIERVLRATLGRATPDTLKAALKRRGLPTRGRKGELVDRLVADLEDQCRFYERVDVASMPGTTVLRGSIGSEVRLWSKIFVPLIYCALGDVPPLAARRVEGLLSTRQRASTPVDLALAASWWAARLSPWPSWVAAVRTVALQDRDSFIARVVGDGRRLTALVFGDGAGYGWLPHPPARQQERVMRDAGIDGEIAACVLTATAKP